MDAPGEDILTTQPDGRYDFAAGSSLAAAHVSGIAALLLSLSPDIDPHAVRRILRRSSTTPGESHLVNAAAAIEVLTDARPVDVRSEEHTSELQSLMRISYAVFCLKKKNEKT